MRGGFEPPWADLQSATLPLGHRIAVLDNGLVPSVKRRDLNTVMRMRDLFVEATYSAFHGTKAAEDFAAFSIARSGTANPAFDRGQDVPAIWASENPQTATVFADADPFGRDAEPGARVIPVNVRLDHPLIADLEADRDEHRSDKYGTKDNGKRIGTSATSRTGICTGPNSAGMTA